MVFFHSFWPKFLTAVVVRGWLGSWAGMAGGVNMSLWSMAIHYQSYSKSDDFISPAVADFRWKKFDLLGKVEKCWLARAEWESSLLLTRSWMFSNDIVRIIFFFQVLKLFISRLVLMITVIFKIYFFFLSFKLTWNIHALSYKL